MLGYVLDDLLSTPVILVMLCSKGVTVMEEYLSNSILNAKHA